MNFSNFSHFSMKLTGDSDAEVWARLEHTQQQDTSEGSKNLFQEIFNGM